jgi:manganese efflux pump family protein
LSFSEILLLSLALAVDAFSIAAVVGLVHRQPRQVFRLSFHFGLFQGLLALIGILIGGLLMGIIEAWDHWIAFSLLLLIGLRMIRNAKGGEERDTAKRDLTRGLSLVGLSLAVSIDALAAGVGLAALSVPVLSTVLLIGLVASLGTLMAFVLAGSIRHWVGRYAEYAAGVFLIGLGIKILIAHTT